MIRVQWITKHLIGSGKPAFAGDHLADLPAGRSGYGIATTIFELLGVAIRFSTGDRFHF